MTDSQAAVVRRESSYDIATTSHFVDLVCLSACHLRYTPKLADYLIAPTWLFIRALAEKLASQEKEGTQRDEFIWNDVRLWYQSLSHREWSGNFEHLFYWCLDQYRLHDPLVRVELKEIRESDLGDFGSPILVRPVLATISNDRTTYTLRDHRTDRSVYDPLARPILGSIKMVMGSGMDRCVGPVRVGRKYLRDHAGEVLTLEARSLPPSLYIKWFERRVFSTADWYLGRPKSGDCLTQPTVELAEWSLDDSVSSFKTSHVGTRLPVASPGRDQESCLNSPHNEYLLKRIKDLSTPAQWRAVERLKQGRVLTAADRNALHHLRRREKLQELREIW